LAIEVKDIYVGYIKGIDVLQGVNLKVKDHQATIIIGPNGSGKSTLLKAICCFLRPSHGQILLNGEDITNERPHNLAKLGISYLPQTKPLFPLMTVEENLKLGGWILRKDSKKLRDAIEKVYQIFPELKAKKRMRAGDLSGGEQTMLLLGKSLMIDPKILILDEPTAGLSPKIASMVYQKLKNLKNDGLTLLLVDQNIKASVLIGDYVYVLERGKNKLEGPADFIYNRLSEIAKGWLEF